MRRAWVPSGLIASLAPKPYAVGVSVSTFAVDMGRWLVYTIDRQGRYGVLKPEPLIVKMAGACLGLVYR